MKKQVNKMIGFVCYIIGVVCSVYFGLWKNATDSFTDTLCSRCQWGTQYNTCDCLCNQNSVFYNNDWTDLVYWIYCL